MEPTPETSQQSATKKRKRSNTIWLAVGLGLALLTAWLYVKFHAASPYEQFKAFRAASASMCPTICENERIIAAMDGYRKLVPQRGDVVMMKHSTSEGLFIKRVIGVGRDLVSLKAGKILVNGQPLSIPTPAKGCGNSGVSSSTNQEQIFFDPVKVPASSFFVVGDNLRNSFDSRIQEFGFVSSAQVRGKPLFIYWSPSSSRIGCPIE